MLEDYKASTNLRSKVAKDAVPSYHISFRECSDKMKQLFPEVNASCIVLWLGELVDNEDKEDGAAFPIVATPTEVGTTTEAIPLQAAA